MTILTVAERLGRARLLMFDLDGTLVDSSPIHARAYRETFGPLGINIDYAAIAGLTTADAVDKLVSEHHLHFGPAQRDELRSTKQRLALEFIRADLEALPGAVEFVREARTRPFRARAVYLRIARLCRRCPRKDQIGRRVRSDRHLRGCP